MKRENLLPAALIALTVALVLNGAALYFGTPHRASVTPPAQAQSLRNAPPNMYFLGRDTHFMTSSSDGEQVYLWYYDFSPDRRDNEIVFVKEASAP